MCLYFLVFCVGFVLMITTPTFAQPVEWPVSSGGNGHTYDVISVPDGISWTSARDAASAAGGYLATLTSQEESDFVYALVDNSSFWNQESGGSNLGPWLGGYQTFDDGTMPTANWTWVTGEAFLFTNWASGEPNNFTGADEDYLSYKCYGTPGCRSDKWNDLPNDNSVFNTPVIAYVIEFDAPSSIPALGPISIILFGCILGAIGCFILWRKRMA